MAQGPPLWLKAVYRVERTIGERVEAAVRSDTYFDAITTATRNYGRARRLAEGVSRECLHLLNLPAGTDIRRVREQLAAMDRRLARITKELADLQHAESADADRQARTRRAV
jgi:hypothetical protein